MDFLKKVASEAITEAVNTNNISSNNNHDNNDEKKDNSNKSNNNHKNNDNEGNSNDDDNNKSNNNDNNNNNNSSAENQVASAVMGKLNNVFGGGEKGEQKEDVLDKAIDLFQERVLKAGSQSNESAVEQAKDAQIAGAIRSGYKTATGKDFPV